jgi:2-polyprenyl-3-methyl-5-hydroxy-6-metoxy-1,4-benzoquinol methylase
MKLPREDEATSLTARNLRRWDLREYFSRDPKDFQTIHYLNRLKTILDTVAHACTYRAAILDIGCAQGTAAILLAERGYRVVAVDADPECLRYAGLRYEFGDCSFVCADVNREGGLESVAPGTEFDLVLLGEVLEHLPRPGTLLKTAATRLRPGGALIVTTPNGAAPHNWAFLGYDPHKMEAHDRSEMGSGLGARETHLFNFRMRTLLETIEAAGLRADRLEFVNSYVVNPIGVHRVLPVAAAATLNRVMSRVPLIREVFTMTLFVLARKPASPVARSSAGARNAGTH